MEIPPEWDLLFGPRASRLAIEYHPHSDQGKRRKRIKSVTPPSVQQWDEVEFIAGLYEMDSPSTSESREDFMDAKKMRLEETSTRCIPQQT